MNGSAKVLRWCIYGSYGKDKRAGEWLPFSVLFGSCILISVWLSLLFLVAFFVFVFVSLQALEMAKTKKSLMAKERCKVVAPQIFGGFNAYFLFDGKTPWGSVKILRAKWLERGGVICDSLNPSTTHIVTSTWHSIVKEFCSCLGCPHRIQSSKTCVHWDWISACLVSDVLVSPLGFRLDLDGEVEGQFAKFQIECGKVLPNGKWVYDENKCSKAEVIDGPF